MSEELEMVPYTYSFCRRCSSRVELGRIAFGATITCPACGLEFVISRQPRSSDAAGQGGGGHDRCDFAEEAEEPAVWEAIRRGPPLSLYLSGTFGFPLRPAMLGRTLTLCAVTVALVAAVRLAGWCIEADNESVDRSTRVLLWNGLLLSIAMGAIALLVWTCVASAYGMTILRETSCGVDVVENWPNMLALEGLGELLYVGNSLILAALPGALAFPLWSRLEVPVPRAIGAVAALLFPMFLLSMLAADSPTNMLSPPVWKSLLRGWRAWLGFHLTTFVAAFAVALTIVLLRRAGGAIGTAAQGVVLAAAWMIYFRLLGRLAWFGSGTAARTQ